jgi:hypothetical protein
VKEELEGELSHMDVSALKRQCMTSLTAWTGNAATRILSFCYLLRWKLAFLEMQLVSTASRLDYPEKLVVAKLGTSHPAPKHEVQIHGQYHNYRPTSLLLR